MKTPDHVWELALRLSSYTHTWTIECRVCKKHGCSGLLPEFVKEFDTGDYWKKREAYVPDEAIALMQGAFTALEVMRRTAVGQGGCENLNTNKSVVQEPEKVT